MNCLGYKARPRAGGLRWAPCSVADRAAMTMEGYYRELDRLYAQLNHLHRRYPSDRLKILQVISAIRDLRQKHANKFQAPEP